MDTKNAAIYSGRRVKTMAQWRWPRIDPRYVKRDRIYSYKDALDEWLRNDLREPERIVEQEKCDDAL